MTDPGKVVTMMLTTKLAPMETVWNTFQEPRCSAYLPNSYMLLLSALDQGWQVSKTELAPSWDQNGFIYLVTLKRQSLPHTQQLIMPQNALVANLLQEYGTTVASNRNSAYQPA